MTRQSTLLPAMYGTMYDALGPSHWWPGESRFEKAVGAILTQNTNWNNAAKAVWNLKDKKVLTPRALSALPEPVLSELIRPAGYFRIKAARLRNFLVFLREEADLCMETLCERGLEELRPKLLSVKGIGPETADSILLYALDKPSFVIDAYTVRIMSRHGVVSEDVDYHFLQGLFMDALPREAPLYNECHALLVRVGKTWCRKKEPRCSSCPLAPLLR
ncbi:MAG: endonuclease III domain-containing protein [Desulfohalobiaceae bacterium]